MNKIIEVVANCIIVTMLAGIVVYGVIVGY